MTTYPECSATSNFWLGIALDAISTGFGTFDTKLVAILEITVDTNVVF